jgi:CHAT domain-containing protein
VEERFSALQKAHARKATDRPGWYATLDEVTAWLWTAAMGPVLAALKQAPAAVLVPTGLLGLLPLHAAWTGHGAGDRCYAIDRVTLTYAPNARALTAVRAIAGEVPGDSLLAVADPDQDADGRLPFAGPEADAARSRFDTALVLRQRSATASQVVRCLARYQVHHFACHATTNLLSPLDSALVLARDDRLSLRTLIGLRPDGASGLGARLAVLSACETHLPGKVLPDEVVGLPTGLLQAGVAGVIASYWAVSDAATALLMTRFYHDWKTGGRSPGEALARAQCWLRDTTNGDKVAWLGAAADAGQLPCDVAATLGRAVNGDDPAALDFRHPVSWAAFAYTGA